MHEASIAANILETCLTVAKQHNASVILQVKVRVGEFTGVVREALEFAFEALKSGTIAERAVLEVTTVPLTVRCRNCGDTESPSGDLCLFCDHCGEILDVIAGRDLLVESIDLE